nr:hypothetical protein [Enterocloster clostridioformis]
MELTNTSPPSMQTNRMIYRSALFTIRSKAVPTVPAMGFKPMPME